MGARTTSAAREAFAAYAANGTGEEIVSSPRPVDAAALRLAILAAGGDARELRALRRLAARALHPDRGGDGAALADCNALIDAALRTSRNKT